MIYIFVPRGSWLLRLKKLHFQLFSPWRVGRVVIPKHCYLEGWTSLPEAPQPHFPTTSILSSIRRPIHNHFSLMCAEEFSINSTNFPKYHANHKPAWPLSQQLLNNFRHLILTRICSLILPAAFQAINTQMHRREKARPERRQNK